MISPVLAQKKSYFYLACHLLTRAFSSVFRQLSSLPSNLRRLSQEAYLSLLTPKEIDNTITSSLSLSLQLYRRTSTPIPRWPGYRSPLTSWRPA